MKKIVAVSVLLACSLIRSMPAHAQTPIQYRVLATNKTSTMQKELNEAGDAGFRFRTAMGGQTSFGGSEVVVITQKTEGSSRFEYRLLATSKTSTMQKELQEAGEQGFEIIGMTVGETALGGSELVSILRRKAK
jgi:hypothetical protein